MRVTTPYEGRGFSGWDAHAPIAAPLRLHRCRVQEQWTDYNAHLSESFFLYIFGDDSDAFFRFFGIDEEYRAGGHSLYTVETHLRHLGEASVDDELACTLRVLGVADRKVHVAHTMHHTDDDRLLATCEQMLVHVDLGSERASPFPAEIRSRLDAIAAAHAQLPVPDWVGRRISL